METKAREITRRRFTVHDYHRMAEAGILHEDDRVELIDGEIVEMNPIGDRHAACVRRLIGLLTRRIGDAAILDVQNPVRLSDSAEPQPDLALLRPRDDLYAAGHPLPEDVLLLIEVSDTTLSYDRGVKLPLYARSGIPEVFIVDLTNEVIERHTEPTNDGYRLTERARRGETLRSVALPALVVPVDAVLG